ncbi:MAG TPA: NADH:flavin oxidoreductase/NADH oxidase [Polyangiaceae bacterium]|nr:NADH:flavin oxidoreductase/NADH oxidase [Polyangiaceae bacterium]
MTDPILFQPFQTGNVVLRNRIVISPMCQYSAGPDGLATDYHLVHLGCRAVGGAGLVMTEATSVLPHGRLSPRDLGIWDDAHVAPLARIASFLKEQGAAAGLQLAHGGRKAAEDTQGREAERLVGASAIPAGAGWRTPIALDEAEIRKTIDAFVEGARRAVRAGFDLIELHAAHGYLFHGFLSPIANRRTDAFGGSLENRARLLVSVAEAVRRVWTRPRPLWVRLSCVDRAAGGLRIEDSVEVARLLAPWVDAVDCSSGGIVEGDKVPQKPGFQLPFSRKIRHETGLATCGVGKLTTGLACERALARGDADVVAVARASLGDPHFPLRAAKELGVSLPYHREGLRTRDLYVRHRDVLRGKLTRFVATKLP